MAKLDIILAPDPRLTTVCEPVADVGPELCQLMDDMLDTMYAAPGIGLAAPQAGPERALLHRGSGHLQSVRTRLRQFAGTH